jgi:hypothetical protein
MSKTVMDQSKLSEACSAVALREALTAGVGTAVAAGAAVVAANSQSPTFARSLGISGKVALVIMP